MAIRLPVESFPAPGVPTPSTTTTSGDSTSQGNGQPSSGSSSGPIIQTVDLYKTKATGLMHPALTSHYQCKFLPPTNAKTFLDGSESQFPGSNYILNQDLIELSCSEASLPGASLMTNEITDDHTGVTERPAYRRQYDDRIDFTFYVSHDYRIINFFERWISYCVGEDSQNDLVNPNYFYRVNFPDDYQTENLYITKFEKTTQPRLGKNIDTNIAYTGSRLVYKFIRAYPLSINSIPVSYESSQLLKCTVSFSFVRYVRKWEGGKAIPKEPKQPTATGVPDVNKATNRALDPLSGPGFQNTELERQFNRTFRPGSGAPSADPVVENAYQYFNRGEEII
jgi:hypothetical protein